LNSWSASVLLLLFFLEDFSAFPDSVKTRQDKTKKIYQQSRKLQFFKCISKNFVLDSVGQNSVYFLTIDQILNTYFGF